MRHQQTIEDLQGRMQDGEEEPVPLVSTTAKDLEEAEEEDEKPVPEKVEPETDFAESEARLTAALVSDGDDGISEDELKAIMGAMRAQAQAGTASEKEKAQKKLIVAIERGKSRNTSLEEHIKKQSELIQKLRADAKEQEDRPPPPPPKDEEPRPPSPTASEAEHDIEAARKVIQNLRRELDLMTSAWFEQSKRLASGGSLRQREPKSFLGRQRRIVEAVPLGGMVR